MFNKSSKYKFKFFLFFQKTSSFFKDSLPLIACLIGFILVGLIIWYVPILQISGLSLNDKDGIKIQNELRGTLIQIFGGGFFLWGLYLAWRRVIIAQEGQITDRFSKAVDQLGEDKMEVRIGGIYALERISKDSEFRDYWAIMEILATYIRNNSQPNLESSRKYKENMGNQNEQLSASKGSKLNPPADIQTALTVIGRRRKSFRNGESEKIDLSKSFLPGCNLMGMNLKGVDFTEATLINSNLAGAWLEGANFYQANMEEANLSQAFLKEALFVNANLSNAKLAGTGLAPVSWTGS